jgi:enoyl-CoA hydratase
VNEPVLLRHVEAGVGVVTLNRPRARNALNSELMAALAEGMAAMDHDESVDAIVLTGADPAFCAGLDLKELASTGANLRGAPGTGRGFWAPVSKPVIGAVNGPAITGGLELALQCDFLVASDRAVFGDTHARVGVVPGGGLSVLLPQAVGVRRAKELSLTGRFIDARQALAWGLVNHVVAHEELLPFTRALAADIVAADRRAARAILDGYRQASLTTVEDGWRLETERFVAFRRSGFDPGTVERFNRSRG